MLRRFLFLFMLMAPTLAAAVPTRLKELTDVQGVRDNELIGYGLVVGLPGTGDTERVFFTAQSMSGMLGRIGVRVDPREIRSRNVAAVMVTGKLSTFTRSGSRIDVTVSSMGNARALTGGTLLLTPLNGPDGQVYALAQGPVQTGGYEAGARIAMFRKNSPTTGRISRGAVTERAVLVSLGKGPLVLQLKEPDFTTASRIAAGIEKSLGQGTARALDAAAVEVKAEDALTQDAVGLLAKLEAIEVEADRRAKVVISERTGTIVAGERVRLRPAAISHGNLHVSIADRTYVSQPGAFARNGNTRVVNMYDVEVNESGRGVAALPETANVEDLAKALNALGVTTRDLVSILQALKAAGSLDAELEVL